MATVGPPPATGPIVLATDFGSVSAAAELRAIRDAAAARTELVVVHAIDPGRLRLPGGLWRARVDQVREQRERDAAGLVQRARRAGVDARVLIWNGDPATCVVDAARGEGAIRIVVGSHGRSAIGRALVGSVSRIVAELAGCPVTVVAVDGRAIESRPARAGRPDRRGRSTHHPDPDPGRG